MPPKAKYTKEQIGEAAFALVRTQGMPALSARSLAAALGTSTAPIFTAFPGIEALQAFVTEKAKALYSAYIADGLRENPPFKGTGLQYIRFAKEEPALFRLLFMQETKAQEYTHFFPAGDENAPAILQTVEKIYGLRPQQAKKLYNHLAVYAHGLAVLYVQKQCIFTMEDVSRMLSELFTALIQTENGGIAHETHS